jgi:hypothetical protein
MTNQPVLSVKQHIALELTKELIQQGHSDPATVAIRHTEQILKSEKQSIGFVKGDTSK